METAACGAALGRQTQKEAADEAAGHDDVPLDEVCGLRRGERMKTESIGDSNEQINQ